MIAAAENSRVKGPTASKGYGSNTDTLPPPVRKRGVFILSSFCYEMGRSPWVFFAGISTRDKGYVCYRWGLLKAEFGKEEIKMRIKD